MDKAKRPTLTEGEKVELARRFQERPHWQQSLDCAQWLDITARKRVNQTPGLDSYEHLLLNYTALPYDVHVHMAWLCTAPEAEIIEWCEDVEWRAQVSRPSPVKSLESDSSESRRRAPSIAELGYAALLVLGTAGAIA